MRWVLGCLSLVFVVFGGCVLLIFTDAGVASDEIVFVIGAVVILLFGIWLFYKAATMPRTQPAGGQRETGGDAP